MSRADTELSTLQLLLPDCVQVLATISNTAGPTHVNS